MKFLKAAAGVGSVVLAALALTAHAQSAPQAATTLSPQGQAAVLAQARGPQPPADLTARRAFIDRYQIDFGARQQARYAVAIENTTIAGVPVRVIRPKGAKPTDAILLDLHGGGFTTDSGSLTENIPIAALTGIPVVAVLYRLAPEHLWPSGVDDALAVYRTLLKEHKASRIGIYGTSAGAVLGPQLIVRLQAEHLPQPAVLGMFAGDADLSRTGGSELAQHSNMAVAVAPYLGKTPATSPAVSALLGDLSFFPPTLCMTSTDDLFLSSTSNFCRALDKAGVSNKLVVFDGLPHAFWAYIDAPESDQAFAIMARYMQDRLVR